MKVPNHWLNRGAIASAVALLALPAVGCASSKVDDLDGTGAEGGSGAGSPAVWGGMIHIVTQTERFLRHF